MNYVVKKPEKYLGVPSIEEWKLSDDADYVYFCYNETVGGISFFFYLLVEDFFKVLQYQSSAKLSFRSGV